MPGVPDILHGLRHLARPPLDAAARPRRLQLRPPHRGNLNPPHTPSLDYNPLLQSQDALGKMKSKAFYGTNLITRPPEYGGLERPVAHRVAGALHWMQERVLGASDSHRPPEVPMCHIQDSQGQILALNLRPSPQNVLSCSLFARKRVRDHGSGHGRRGWGRGPHGLEHGAPAEAHHPVARVQDPHHRLVGEVHRHACREPQPLEDGDDGDGLV